MLRAAIRDRDSVARLGGDEFAVLLENCPPAARRAHRAGVAANDPGVQLHVGRQDVQDRRQHRPGRVPRRQRRSARADACCRRCLLRREEERPQSHPRLPADGRSTWRRGRASWIGWGGCAGRWMKAASACTRRRWSASPAARKGERHQELLVRMIDDDQQVIDPIVFIPVAERYNLMPAVDRLVISTAFAEFARIIEREGRVGHAPMVDQSVGRIFEPGRFPGVRPHAVRRLRRPALRRSASRSRRPRRSRISPRRRI